jgi:hypothetical protein
VGRAQVVELIAAAVYAWENIVGDGWIVGVAEGSAADPTVVAFARIFAAARV